MDVRISEFHYIAPIDNLGSIFTMGILSHNEAVPYKKADVSMKGVQDIRAAKEIPEHLMGQAKRIHDCANLYFNAKNPMLSVRRTEKDSICILRLRPDLLNRPGAVVSDRNAAVKNARFFTAAQGVQNLAMTTLFGQYWTSKYNTDEQNKVNKELRCAELLLPHKIHPSYIGGMYVASEAVKQAVLARFPAGCPVEITVHPQFFFDEKAVTPQIPPLGNKIHPNPIEYPVPEETEAVAVKPTPEIQSPEKKRIIVDLTQEPQEAKVVAKPVEVIDVDKVVTLPVAPSPVAPTPVAPAPAVTKTVTSPKRGLDQWLVTKKPTPVGTKAATAPYEHTFELPAHITMKDGDLLNSQMQTLVNTVNCKGAMGKGIAEMFKSRYGAMFRDYKSRCDKAQVKPGVPYVYKTEDGKLVLNFPTKNHWRDPSQLMWIQKGLDAIKNSYREWGITSLALPPLGCGNGGLDWRTVRKMIIGTLAEVNIPIEIYNPRNDT